MKSYWQGLIALLLIVACAANAQIKKTLDIGVIYNTTGDQAPLGQAALRGAKLALSEINQHGGIRGHKLHLIIKNGASDPVRIKKIAQQLAADPNIILVMGLNDNNMVMAAAPVVAQAKKLFITSGATSPGLLLAVPKYLYLVSFGDNVQAAAAADYISKTLHVGKVAVVYDRDMQYAKSLASYFSTAYVDDGGTVSYVKSFRHGALSATDIAKIKALSPQPALIYLAVGPTELQSAIMQLYQAGIHSTIMGGDSYIVSEIRPVLVDKTSHVYFTTPVFLNLMTSNVTVRDFMQRYYSHYHQYPHNPFTALGYDSVNLIAHVLKKSQSFKTPALISSLQHLRDMNAVTGSISYLHGRRLPHKPVTIVEVTANGARLVEQVLPNFIPKAVRY